MPNASEQPAAPIRARVHDGALRRVTRFFSSTPVDIFSELLQNARRAGATCVGRRYRKPPRTRGRRHSGHRDRRRHGRRRCRRASVVRRDRLGRSHRAERGCRRHGARLAGPARLPRVLAPSRVQGRSRPGWRIALTPAHFLGEENAIPLPDNGAPYPNGTAVSFKGDETLDAIEGALARAALHYPLAVTFNGEAVDRRAFLDGTVHAEPWRGIMFGAFKNGCRATTTRTSTSMG